MNLRQANGWTRRPEFACEPLQSDGGATVAVPLSHFSAKHRAASWFALDFSHLKEWICPRCMRCGRGHWRGCGGGAPCLQRGDGANASCELQHHARLAAVVKQLEAKIQTVHWSSLTTPLWFGLTRSITTNFDSLSLLSAWSSFIGVWRTWVLSW